MSHSGPQKLFGELRPVEDISTGERERMYELLSTYFNQTSFAQFESDLAEKQACILLRDADRETIQGFSTLQTIEETAENQRIIAIFSGDTIIDRKYWGATELMKIWAEHVFGLAEKHRGSPVYWFLITSGYRTYRFLPVFFREFFPTHTCRTPPETKRLIDALAELKFSDDYSATTGVVRFSEPTPLKSGISEVTPERLKDPHIEYFARINPGYVEGDELACVTRIDYDNLTRAGRRFFPKSCKR